MRCWHPVLLLTITLTLACRLCPVSAQDAMPSGWRGDGTGKYPSAEPPVTWSRVSTAMEGLRFAGHKPAAGEAGTPMPDGVIRQWLVLGPVPFPQDAKVEKDSLPGETELAPDEGQTSGGLTWKQVTLDTAYLDFARLIGKPADTVAYACTHVYCAGGRRFRHESDVRGPGAGRAERESLPPFGARYQLDLLKGWNRILLKVSPGSKEATGVADWYAVPVLRGGAAGEYRQSNIAWRTALAGGDARVLRRRDRRRRPVIVGERLYLPSEPHDLVCLRKTDGKVLWLRRSSYFEAAGDEEQRRPAYQDAAALAAKIDRDQRGFRGRHRLA